MVESRPAAEAFGSPVGETCVVRDLGKEKKPAPIDARPRAPAGARESGGVEVERFSGGIGQEPPAQVRAPRGQDTPKHRHTVQLPKQYSVYAVTLAVTACGDPL